MEQNNQVRRSAADAATDAIENDAILCGIALNKDRELIQFSMTPAQFIWFKAMYDQATEAAKRGQTPITLVLTAMAVGLDGREQFVHQINATFNKHRDTFANFFDQLADAYEKNAPDYAKGMHPRKQPNANEIDALIKQVLGL